MNALLVTLLSTTLLCLIIIGSTIAFNVITSLGVVGLMSSYTVAIGCMTVKRLRHEPMLPSRFSLGKAGRPINIAALCFSSFSFVFLFFPAAPNPDPASMNWASVMFGVLIIISLCYYYTHARHVYVGPVEYVKKSD